MTEYEKAVKQVGTCENENFKIQLAMVQLFPYVYSCNKEEQKDLPMIVFKIKVKNKGKVLTLIIHGEVAPLYTKKYSSPYIPIFRSNTDYKNTIQYTNLPIICTPPPPPLC